MTRLRLIKDWGPHKAGDIIEPQEQRTVMWLVERHKVAVVEPEPRPVVETHEPKPDENIEPKNLRSPKRDKMLKGPRRAK